MLSRECPQAVFDPKLTSFLVSFDHKSFYHDLHVPILVSQVIVANSNYFDHESRFFESMVEKQQTSSH